MEKPKPDILILQNHEAVKRFVFVTDHTIE